MPRSISSSLISWYRENKRDLPWRRTRDPYAILVSEFMLQQTQLAAVVPYYLRFMSRFPTPSALAVASESDALAAWEGLGYYRRLLNLKASAALIHEAGWPDDLRSLAGVGKYTAAAVGSIAFDRHAACADGNVRRVWSRFLARDCSLTEAESQSAELMARHAAGEWNQAVMELGAVICKPKKPECGLCPISFGCASHRQGCTEKYPAAAATKAMRVDQVCACAIRGKRVGVRRCEPGEWWQGMYAFPRTSLNAGEAGEEAAGRLGLRQPESLGTLHHVVTHHRIRLQAFAGKPTRDMTVEWRTLDELAQLPMPKPARRVTQWLEDVL